MGNSLLQLIVLAAVAMFLILKLRRTLGTRDGFENPRRPDSSPAGFQPREGDSEDELEIDRDISKFVEADSDSAKALARMKQVDGEFAVADFMEGAGGAYEMILLAFAEDRLEDIKQFISEEVFASFDDSLSERDDEATHVVRFVGLRECRIKDVRLDGLRDAEITVDFVAELISYVKNDEGEIIEGDDKTVRRQRDIWTFARDMGSRDPNWRLVATGE